MALEVDTYIQTLISKVTKLPTQVTISQKDLLEPKANGLIVKPLQQNLGGETQIGIVPSIQDSDPFLNTTPTNPTMELKEQWEVPPPPDCAPPPPPFSNSPTGGPHGSRSPGLVDEVFEVSAPLPPPPTPLELEGGTAGLTDTAKNFVVQKCDNKLKVSAIHVLFK